MTDDDLRPRLARVAPVAQRCLVFAGILCCAIPAWGTPNAVQSPARPFGLDIVGAAQTRRSDSRSQTFFGDEQNGIGRITGAGLTAPVNSGPVSTVVLDLNRINLAFAYDVRAYFVTESASYHNSIGFNPSGAGVSAGAKLVLPDASIPAKGARTTTDPLFTYDFVDFGNVAAGSSLDFFAIANGANGGTTVLGLNPATNPDGLSHVAIQARVDRSSPYLLLGFEDLVGGDYDYNDVVLALDIGAANVQSILNSVGAPEPGSMALLGSLLVIGYGAQRRRRGR